MSYTYAIAEIEWKNNQIPGVNWPIKGSFCRPALFHTYPDTLWSLCMTILEPVFPGESVTIPVTLLVEGKSSLLLTPGATFDLLPDGTHVVATGKVKSIEAVDDAQEFRRIFHRDEYKD
jgi:hypothetical protein